jgi:hypothetical protein
MFQKSGLDISLDMRCIGWSGFKAVEKYFYSFVD